MGLCSTMADKTDQQSDKAGHFCGFLRNYKVWHNFWMINNTDTGDILNLYQKWNNYIIINEF